ncbi:MAG: hypothetical protein J7J98_02040 [candidate division Zixibacteria bacterium]|nr:hypothetical protein [candidate division Zixibacteria bacterium]
MDIAGFFTNIASSYREKYLNLAQRFSPGMPTPTQQPEAPNVHGLREIDTPKAPIDEYLPTGDPVSKETPISTITPENKTSKPTNETDTPTGEIPVEQKPDGTYYYQRQAQLDYQLNLKFDLATITRTIESIADGDTEAIEEFAAGGFGLHVGFDIKGIQRVRTNIAELDDPTRRHQLTEAKSRRAGQFAAQSRDFAVKSFFKEASRVHRSLNENASGKHRQTVSRFAARFRLDNQFSFAHLQRFNIQTERVADESPDNLPSYIGSAGQVAETGSGTMMTAFFDAVDAYLDDSEQAILDKVTAFFDAAAEDLGFSGAMVDQAREHLTGTIAGFFDRIETAMAGMESRFAPEISTPIPEVIPEPPANDPLKPADLEYSQALATG